MSAALPSPRMINLLGLLGCIAAMGGALYLQHVEGLPPCPLCIFQRVAVIAAGLILLVAVLHGPKGWGRRLYAGLTALATLVGGAIAARHVWLQGLPADQVPDCGPGLNYMMDVFPLQQVVQEVLAGSGECADINWNLLGLSLPAWSLLFFAGLLVLALVQLVRPNR